MRLPYRMRILKQSVIGTSAGREIARASQKDAFNLSERLACLKSICPGEEDGFTGGETPIFVCSAGWRSGSTLLQRMLMARSNILIWGEPYDRSAIVQKLADMCRPFTDEWPLETFFIEEREEKLSESWIANLYPPVRDFRVAHRDILIRLFAHTAMERGYDSWGIKEVRWTVAHAEYLQWLFPKAKFVFVIRSPLDAYRSYLPWRRWFREWPNQPVLTPYRFGAMWSEMVEDLVQNHSKVNGILVFYEELEKRANDIAEFVNRPVEPPSALLSKRGREGVNPELTFEDRQILRITTWRARQQVGY